MNQSFVTMVPGKDFDSFLCKVRVYVQHCENSLMAKVMAKAVHIPAGTCKCDFTPGG